MPWSWDADTRPFSTGAEPAQPGRFELRQIGDDTFTIITPFVFTWDGGANPIHVTPEVLGPTDLASIPTFLGWFARRHGRHTPAALLHDQLIHERRTTPVEADRLFRDALIASGVPLVKSWVLWTGVTLGSRWRSGGSSAAAMIAWFLAALAGTGLLVYAIATRQPSLAAVALLAPVPFAALWGRQYRAGLIAGYGFWPVLFGSAPAWLAYQAYRLAEYVALWLRKLRPRNRDVELPGPEKFSKR